MLDRRREGHDAVREKRDLLLLQAGPPVTAFVGLHHHPGRNAEPSTNFLDAVPSRLQQLCVGRVDADHLRLDALLEHRALAGIQGSGDRLYILTKLNALSRVQRLVHRKRDRGHHAVAESAVGRVIGGHRRTENICAVTNGRKAYPAVQGKRRDVQHVLPHNLPAPPLSRPEEVPQPAIIIELKVDPGRHQEVQRNDAACRSMDLAVGVAPQQH
ncbi:hypothetical protein D9M71_534250 [compost metagenome]